jgi:hypothetical protein
MNFGRGRKGKNVTSKNGEGWMEAQSVRGRAKVMSHKLETLQSRSDQLREIVNGLNDQGEGGSRTRGLKLIRMASRVVATNCTYRVLEIKSRKNREILSESEDEYHAMSQYLVKHCVPRWLAAVRGFDENAMLVLELNIVETESRTSEGVICRMLGTFLSKGVEMQGQSPVPRAKTTNTQATG